MARKDLSRTVIEGGRYYRNCDERRRSHRVARASQRDWLRAVQVDPELADDSDIAPRPRVRRRFRDKLGPARRWLDRQVGRPWDKVHADLCARFDTRTIAGRHVVHDHLLGWVWRGDLSRPDYYRERDFVVDRRGTLRRGRRFGNRYGALARDRDRSATLRHGRRPLRSTRARLRHPPPGVGARAHVRHRVPVPGSRADQ